MKNYVIDINKIVRLVFFIISVQFVDYYLNSLNITSFQFSTLVPTFLILVIIYSDMKNFLFYASLLAYIFLELICFSTLGSRVYALNFISLIFAIKYFTNKKIILSYNNFSLKKFQICIVVFVLVYYLTAITNNLFGHVLAKDGRVFIVGFLIPHFFSYLTAIFGHIILKNGSIIVGSLVLISGAIAGSRVGIILNLLPLLLLMPSKKIIYVILFFIITTFTYNQLPYNSIIKSGIEKSLLTYSLYDSSNSLSDNTKFTSGRSTLWANAFDEIKYFTFVDYVFGKGPAASTVLNYRINGIAHWMHNDLIDIFYCLGILGLTLYLYSIYSLISNLGFPIYISTYIAIAAMLNGFFPYSGYLLIMLFYVNSKMACVSSIHRSSFLRHPPLA